jgi:hypothetical protein
MPLFESACPSRDCPDYAQPVEHYYPYSHSTTLPCEKCGGPTVKLVSQFHVVFTGPITAKYNDKHLDGAHREGHWGFNKDPVTGKSTPAFIETFQQQKDFCKRNKLVNPKDAPTNFEVSADGTTIQNTRGLPGSWI